MSKLGFWVVLTIAVIFVVGCNAVAGPTPVPTQSGQDLPNTESVQELTSRPGPASTRSPLPVPTQASYLPILPVWGIELYYIGGDGGLDLVKQAGAYWVRRNALIWSDVEPVEGERDWEALAGLEAELLAAAAQVQQVILVVRSTPEWAQSTPGSLCSPPSPEKLSAFADFMKDVVQRYSIPPYNVQYWEIGNEPDIAPELTPSDTPFGCWGKTGDPYYGGEYYAEILRAIYPQVKSANPQAQVLIGGLLLNCDPINPPETKPGSGEFKDCVPSRYLEGVLAKGGGDFFDGISYHAYDYYGGKLGQYSNSNWSSAWNLTGPTLIAKADYIRGLLTLYGIQGKFLINTESAILCGQDGNEPYCQAEEYQLTKAYYLAQVYVSAIAEQLMGNIWYSLTGWRGSGLVDNTIKPNEAYQALKNSATQLTKAGFVKQITEYGGVRGYAFERAGAPLWVLWSLDGANHTITLDGLPKSTTDVFGAPMAVSQDLTVTLAPIYLEFSK